MLTTAQQHDDVLIDGLRKGDEEIFGLIFRKYWFSLYQVAYKKVQSHEDAEEIVQSLFVELWEKREQLSINDLGKYLRTSLRNRFIDFVRKTMVEDKYAVYYKSFSTFRHQHTEESIAYNDLREQMTKGLSQLPEKTREILSLSRMAGLSNHQIAKRTKLSEKSVEYHISKCIKLLRRHLQDFLAVLVILVEC